MCNLLLTRLKHFRQGYKARARLLVVLCEALSPWIPEKNEHTNSHALATLSTMLWWQCSPNCSRFNIRLQEIPTNEIRAGAASRLFAWHFRGVLAQPFLDLTLSPIHFIKTRKAKKLYSRTSPYESRQYETHTNTLAIKHCFREHMRQSYVIAFGYKEASTNSLVMTNRVGNQAIRNVEILLQSRFYFGLCLPRKKNIYSYAFTHLRPIISCHPPCQPTLTSN